MTGEMRSFLTAFRKRRGWSLKELASRLGYASANSLVRLEQEKANMESVLHFVSQMHQTDDLDMTEEEAHQLDSIAERIQLSDDAYHATAMLHSLLRCEPQPDHTMLARDFLSGVKQNVFDIYQDRKVTQLLILNCLDMPSYTYVDLSHVPEIEHYMLVDDLASHTVQRVLRLLPMLYLPHYNAYTMTPPADQPIGMLRSDLVVIEYQVDDRFHCDLLVANSPEHFDVYHLPQPMDVVKPFLVPDPSLFQPFGDHRLRRATDFVDYLRCLLEMERDRTVLRLKPDFGVEQIPDEIQIRAAVDQINHDPATDEAISAQLELLMSLITQRYQNYRTKHQAQYHVYQKQAMWRFVKSGILSDQPWVMRPFTVQERIQIIRATLDAIRENPYLHITFLRSEDTFRSDELLYYEGTGVSIIKPQTDYHLDDPHREALISHEKFMRVFRSFFLHSIIGCHTISESDAIKEFNAMLSYLANFS